MLKKMDKTLLITSIFLLLVGLIMVFSASNVTSFMKFKVTPYYFFNRQLIFMIISFILSLFIIRFKTTTYGKLSWIIIIGLIGALILVLLYGKITNQARSWFSFSGVKFQPSEFVKVASIVWMAYFCTSKQRDGIKSYALLFVIIGTIFLLIVFQPDFGTACIYALIIFMMFLALNINKKVKRIIVVSLVVIGSVFLILLKSNAFNGFFERQAGRLTSFLKSPCSEENFYTTGTQLCNGYIAINNGGFSGLGLGNSTQKYLYLPEAYTDFIFAITVEELGLGISIVILILLFIVLWRIFIISKRASTEYGRLMCYGIFWYILFHIVVNLGGVFGLLPLTGVPLPFLSYGGSFLMCLIISLTIVQRVCIESKT